MNSNGKRPREPFNREEFTSKIAKEFQSDRDDLIPSIIKNQEAWKDICTVHKDGDTFVITYIEDVPKDTTYTWVPVHAYSKGCGNEMYIKHCNEAKYVWMTMAISSDIEDVMSDQFQVEIEKKYSSNIPEMAKKLNTMILKFPHKDYRDKSSYVLKFFTVLRGNLFNEHMIPEILESFVKTTGFEEEEKLAKRELYLKKLEAPAVKDVRNIRRRLAKCKEKMVDPGHISALALLEQFS